MEVHMTPKLEPKEFGAQEVEPQKVEPQEVGAGTFEPRIIAFCCQY
jgi:hypothetical protein